jgi:hypothetical protein
MGGQAAVWKGTGPNGPVVLKFARTEQSRPALRREARVLMTVRHPNLVRLVDADPGGAWLALEQIEGLNFDAWAQSRSFDEIVDATVQLADVLDQLQKGGVIHGDLKPSNVIVTASGSPRVIDLGVASPMSGVSRTGGGPPEGFRGTLGYAAPELLRGQAPTPATDLYGLGALLYTAITGRTPFVAPDPTALSYLPLVSLPAPPAAFRPEIPAPLNQLILQLLAKDPDRRPSDLGKLRESLERCRLAPPAPPFLGMLEEREEIWRAVVGAADGEPRVVVVYGVPGSGRRTLIAEAVECARREGLPYLKGTEPGTAIEAIREAGRPVVLVMKGAHKSARQLADTVLKDKLSCLLLLHSDRPVAGLTVAGAIQLTPSPLSSADAVRIARVWSADVDQAETWWRESLGLPIAFLARIRLWRRNTGQTATAGTQHLQLPAESKRIYEALRLHSKGRCEVSELARELQMGEHMLLDHCEVLFAEELVEPADDGLAIAMVRSKGV